MRAGPVLVFTLGVLITGCGTLADAGHEARGDENLPSAGVAPWDKVDLDGDPTNLVQPWVLTPMDHRERLEEPAAIQFGSSFVLYYARSAGTAASGIWRTEAATPEDLYHAGPGGRVIEATLSWEQGAVNAPSVVIDEARPAGERFRLWYHGANGTGIGLASSEDGVGWIKHGPPVLVADQTWEAGRVASPSVVRVGSELWLWYQGGDGAGIGFAKSSDGISWTKIDGVSVSPAGADRGVGPVFHPELDWEGATTEGVAPGSVGSPSVILDVGQTPPRFGMYYSGFVDVGRNPLTATPNPDATPGSRNRSIGYAASIDGVHWTRADPSMNPIVAEKTPVQIGSVPFPPGLLEALPAFVVEVLRQILGTDDAGNPRLPAIETVIDEGEPCVVGDGPDRFVMLFDQSNSLFVPLALTLPASPVTTPLGLLVQDARAGLALARRRR
jgi:hypothetical protein